MNAKVRHDLLHLTVDVPADDALSGRHPIRRMAYGLSYAEQTAHGCKHRFNTDNPGGLDKHNLRKPLVVPAYELDALEAHPQ